MSFDKAITLSPLGAVAEADIAQFDATALLGVNTEGNFSLYFDGSTWELSADDVDAFGLPLYRTLPEINFSG